MISRPAKIADSQSSRSNVQGTSREADPAAELATVLQLARNLLQPDAVAIWRFKDDQWSIATAFGLSQRFQKQILAASESIPPTGPFIADDVTAAPFLSNRHAALAEEKIKALMAIPIFAFEKCYGTVTFYFRAQHSFTPDEVERGETLARLTSTALVSSELYKEQRKARERADFLVEASRLLASSLDYEHNLAALAELAVPHIADWCVVDVLGDDGRLHRLAAANSDPEKVRRARKTILETAADLRPTGGIAETIVQGEPCFYPEITDRERELNSGPGGLCTLIAEPTCSSAMLMPLVARSKTLGVISFIDSESGRHFDETDLKLVGTLANRAGIAIDNSKLFLAVQESEQKFRAVSETASCAIYIHDGKRILYVNQASEAISGYSREELLQIDMFSLVHPDDRELVRKRAEQRFIGGNVPERYEYRIVRKDGGITWLDFTAATIDFGGHRALLATAFDITERKLAQQRLQERELEARTLLQSIPFVISRFNRELRYLYIAPQVEKMIGRPPSEFTGKRFCDLGFPQDTCEKFEASIESVFRTGDPNSIEFSLPNAAGEVRHFVGNAVADFGSEGRVDSVVTLTRDVTDQRKTQDKVRRSEADLRVITDTIPALVAYIDTSERFVRVNRVFEAWFERPVSSFVGKHIAEVLGAENYRHVEDKVRQALSGKLVQFETLNEYNGRKRNIFATYAPDVDENGNVRGFVALITDVTDRKQAEEALRRSEKLATAGRLAATIAHEINNPLEAITNLLYLLKSETPGSPMSAEYIDMADHELRRVSHIARQTLGFYRESAGPTRFAVKSIVDEVLSLMGRRIHVRGVELERRFESEGMIIAPQGEARQIIANLITNAVDATENGRLIIRVAGSSDPVTQLPRVIVTVADTGQGISKENRSKMFEPFFTTKKDIGTGLGLWVTRQLLEKNGGSIRVRSRAGVGTVFRVTFPELPPTVG